MSDKHRQVAGLMVEVIPRFMRALASDWRQVEHSPVPGQFRVLFVLTQGPLNLSALASKLQVSLPTMSSSITTLVDRGWVARRRDPDDGRKVLIEITPEGCGMLAHIRDVAQAHIAQALRELSEAECEQIITGLAALSRAFDQQSLSRDFRD